MFFTGDHQNKRKVNLGGKKKSEDKDTLLLKAKLEREKRLREKLENRSATLIQKFYRGRREVRGVKSQIKNEFISKYGAIGEKVSPEEFSVTSNCINQILFFARADNLQDFSYFVSLSKLILALGGRGKFLGTFLNQSSEDTAILCLRMKKLTFSLLQAFKTSVLCANSLDEKSGISESDDICVRRALLFLCTNLPQNFQITEFLASKGLFPILRRILLLQMDENSDRTYTRKMPVNSNVSPSVEEVSLKLTLQFFATINPSSNNKSTLMTAFFTHLGTIPFLLHCFPSFLKSDVRINGSTNNDPCSPWQSFVDCFLSTCSDCSFGGLGEEDVDPYLPSRLCLLTNLISGLHEGLKMSTLSRKSTLSLVSVLNNLLPPLMSVVRAKTAAEHLEYDSEEEMADEHSGATFVSPSLLHEISLLSEKIIMNHLASSCLSDPSASQKSPPLSNQLTATELAYPFFSLLLKLTSVFPTEKNKILANLALVRTKTSPGQAHKTFSLLLTLLWLHLHQMKTSAHIPKDLNSIWSFEPFVLLVAVFCPVFTFVLVSGSFAQEITDGSSPLLNCSLTNVVTFLKEAIWDLLSPDSNLSEKYLKRSFGKLGGTISHDVARLLSEFQKQNMRLRFTDPESFLLPEAQLSALTSRSIENLNRIPMITSCPFLVPFSTRLQLYNHKLRLIHEEESSGAGPLRFSQTEVQLRRERVLEDSFDQLHSISPESWRQTIRISYVNEYGLTEAGVDGGGMLKDFLENITKHIFNVNLGLFAETNQHLLYPARPSSLAIENSLEMFEFAGKILAKAMYDGILVDIHFAPFFLNRLLRSYNYLHDLPCLDPELYRNLVSLKKYEGDLEELSLTFVIEESDLGEVRQTELIHGGRNVAVTRDNLGRYLWLVASHYLNGQIEFQTNSFLCGFHSIIPKELILMFSQSELQTLISGSDEGINLADLISNCHYSNGYHADHAVIKLFWEVMLEMGTDKQHSLLKFVTGCSRGPLLGFSQLEPMFCIQRSATSDTDVEAMKRLPTAATCVNLLKLPPYTDKGVMREKLLYAISAGAGFELS